MLPGSDFYLAAFWELSSDRPVGMAVAAIPFTSIDRYAARYGIEGEEFAYFSQMIRVMDAVALQHWREQDGEQKPAAKVMKGRELTPELFDAVFG